MGGALAIPIIPNGGYRRVAPPLTQKPLRPKWVYFDIRLLAVGFLIPLIGKLRWQAPRAAVTAGNRADLVYLSAALG
mgnify:FL=1